MYLHQGNKKKSILSTNPAQYQNILQVDLVNDNLYEWHVRLHQIDPESELANDLRELHIPHILLHLVFPENFPFAPPFMRVIEPRIEKGFVMEGTYIQLLYYFLYHWLKKLSNLRIAIILQHREIAKITRDQYFVGIITNSSTVMTIFIKTAV